MSALSRDYLDLEGRGPFPNQIDPWVEAGRYFHPLHNEIISQIMLRLRGELRQLGYTIGREASLQVTELGKPDLYIQSLANGAPRQRAYEYATAAEGVLAEPGVLLNAEPELDGLHIRHLESGDLVTIIEIVSPKNKESQGIIQAYVERRQRQVLEQGVNVVEIDLTRSVQHLVYLDRLNRTDYHIAVHLPDPVSRVIRMAYGEPLKRFALPLRREVVAVELQPVYADAYRNASCALHMDHEGHYTEANLPYPSLLTDGQRQSALLAVQTWRDQLHRLRSESG